MAGIAPATSTCAMIQPPNTSPLALTSAGIGMTRRAGCLFGNSVGISGTLIVPVVEWAARKGREASTEYYSGIGQIGVGNDPFIHQLLRAFE